MPALRNVYLVVATDDSKDAMMEAVREGWQEGDRYALSQTAVLVKDTRRPTRAIADRVGFSAHAQLIEQDQPSTGIVFRLEDVSYSGFADEALWEWISEVGKR